MPHRWYWHSPSTAYLSGPGSRGTVGVLVLAHGYGQVGDEAFRSGPKPVAARYPLAVAFGMSMTSSAHIQLAVDQLTGAGAATIAVVPALSSSASDDQLRQWQYMFGLTCGPNDGSIHLVLRPYTLFGLQESGQIEYPDRHAIDVLGKSVEAVGRRWHSRRPVRTPPRPRPCTAQAS